MSYTITLTNGNILTSVGDGEINQTVTDLTLIGKNSTGYGGFINDNFVWLLENFANSTQPNHPVLGQLWYDTSESRLKVYDGASFAVTSGTVVSSTAPSNITKGDLWINSSTGQLFFNDGLDTRLAGPGYTSSQGITGFNVEDVVDVNGVQHTVLVLYVAKTVIGVFSKDTFVPATPISGFTNQAQVIASQTENVLTVTSIISGGLSVGQTLSGIGVTPGSQITGQLTGDTGSIGTYTVSELGSYSPTTVTASSNTIKVGFNAGAYAGIIFDTIATRTQSLIAADGTLKTAESFLSSTDNSSTTGQLVIQNENPLLLGPGQNVGFIIDTNSNQFQINSNTINQNIGINTLTGNRTLQNSVFINAQNRRVGIYTLTPSAMLDVAGDVNIQGSLTVLGNVTTVNSTTVAIADKNIILGDTDTPDDTTASLGGVTLLGDTDKTIVWDSTATTGSTNDGYWSFSDNVNVGSTSLGYYINGQSVLSFTSLGTTVTSAPGLNSIGKLGLLNVSNLKVGGTGSESTIAYVNPLSSSGTITLVPKGTGTIDVSSSTITSVGDPVNDTDAATKGYVDTTVTSAPLAVGLVTTGLTNAQIGANILIKMFPSGEHQNNTICRVQCSDGTVKLYQLLSGVWTYQLDL